MSLVMMGFGVTGRAVVAACGRRGVEVVVVDDALDDAMRDEIGQLGATALPPDELVTAVREACSIVVTPGLADDHPVFAAARDVDVEVIDEFDLASRWDDRPCVAITGTNGKTTVTMMVAEMLRASGIAARDAGNTDVPLVEAIEDGSAEVFVVEASSFRLGHAKSFAPSVAAWLNFAPDHLDVHRDLAAYEAAKAAIWDRTSPETIVVANLDDPVVMSHVPVHAQLVSFGVGGDFACEDGVLTASGEQICDVSDMPRALPHDIDNALAAAAVARAAGATMASVAGVIASPPVLAHRVALVAEVAGVAFYDDSKATVPQATIAAVSGFDRVVLLAGGRNKGLDLTPLAEVADRLRAVVAIGEASDEIAEVFASTGVVVRRAKSMSEAVKEAAELAHDDDVVLLSPACASFDMYANYAQRGDDFADAVRELTTARDEGGE